MPISLGVLNAPRLSSGHFYSKGISGSKTSKLLFPPSMDSQRSRISGGVLYYSIKAYGISFGCRLAVMMLRFLLRILFLAI